jgi:hypothetical protein
MKRSARERFRKFEKLDSTLVSADYIAAVYGERPALAHIDSLDIRSEELKEKLRQRARDVGRIGLVPHPHKEHRASSTRDE